MSILKQILLILLGFSLTLPMNKPSKDSIVLGGGCFWCLEAIFERVDGVIDVASGYAGGHSIDPSYKDVCSGKTGHAEVVKITYDTAKISYSDIIDIFLNTHDPTTLNRQGNDIGTQYRSIILYTSPDEEKIIINIIDDIDNSSTYKNKIVTEVKKLEKFYKAEISHQDYYNNNKQAPYCNYVIKPKIDKAKQLYQNIK